MVDSGSVIDVGPQASNSANSNAYLKCIKVPVPEITGMHVGVFPHNLLL